MPFPFAVQEVCRGLCWEAETLLVQKHLGAGLLSRGKAALQECVGCWGLFMLTMLNAVYK